MQSLAPLQIEFNISSISDNYQRLFSPLNCRSVISLFLQAEEISYEFKKGKNLHRLYEKAVVIKCSSDASPYAVLNLCNAARQGGFFTRVVATPILFETLLKQGNSFEINISEAWMYDAALHQESVQGAWKSLLLGGSSVVLLERPDVAAAFEYLDQEYISGSTFRIVSQDVYQSLWPIGFRIDETGVFSRPLKYSLKACEARSLCDLTSTNEIA